MNPYASGASSGAAIEDTEHQVRWRLPIASVAFAVLGLVCIVGTFAFSMFAFSRVDFRTLDMVVGAGWIAWGLCSLIGALLGVIALRLRLPRRDLTLIGVSTNSLFLAASAILYFL